MNRKFIVNDQLAWPDISESDSQKIVSLLENYFKKFACLKRKRTLPKHLRKKQEPESKKEVDFGSYLKAHIKIGINTITKCLEKDANNLVFVLVCKSCKLLNVLTRHIQVMCSLSNVPSGCVNNLAQNLSKIFNIKTVSCIALCKNINSLNEAQNYQDFNKTYLEFLADINQTLIPLLPILKNPFIISKPFESNLLIDNVESELNNVCLYKEENLKQAQLPETFGSDFISVNRTNQSSVFTDFYNPNFILFEENQQIEMEQDYQDEYL